MNISTRTTGTKTKTRPGPIIGARNEWDRDQSSGPEITVTRTGPVTGPGPRTGSGPRIGPGPETFSVTHITLNSHFQS